MPLPTLSNRELDVLRLIADGFTNAGIAQELHVSVPTVARHLETARHKLLAENRSHAVAIAIRLGEIN